MHQHYPDEIFVTFQIYEKYYFILISIYGTLFWVICLACLTLWQNRQEILAPEKTQKLSIYILASNNHKKSHVGHQIKLIYLNIITSYLQTKSPASS